MLRKLLAPMSVFVFAHLCTVCTYAQRALYTCAQCTLYACTPVHSAQCTLYSVIPKPQFCCKGSTIEKMDNPHSSLLD